MNKLKISTAIATASILVAALAPIASASTVNVTGNGAFAHTNVTVKATKGTVVAQGNYSNVTNVVNSTVNTGHNTSSFNTGGTSAVTTGNATSNVNVTVGGSANTAHVTSDCGCNSNATVNVDGNGAFSSTKVKVANSSWLTVLQTNVSNILNVVSSKSSTGGNNSSFNTGSVSVVETSSAASNVTVNVTGSTNTLNQ